MSNSQAAPLLLARATAYRMRGRVHFIKDCIGDVSEDEDEDFVVFRKMVLEPDSDGADGPGAVFKVKFQFARLSAPTNKKLSLLPAPLIAAQPGFRSKTWMLGQQTGLFQGVYEWQTIANAEAYWTSFPMRLMKRRAVPESLWHQISAI